MLRFQVSLHGPAPKPGDVDALTVTFELASAQLALLPRLFIEPDGSFVWRGSDTKGEEWQVDGNLIDRGDVLAYIELNGYCPPDRFNELLQAVGWPQQALAFQLPRRGVVLDEAEFRRQAESNAGAI